MKSLTCFIIMLLSVTVSFAQPVLEGDQLLSLLGKNISDPLFQQLKTQEAFLTDAWNAAFNIYIDLNGNTINKVELENGKMQYGSSDRYGYYKKQLPMQLNWNMDRAAFTQKFGEPDLKTSGIPFKDYNTDGYKLRVFFENDKPVSISFIQAEKSTIAVPVPQKPGVAKHSDQLGWPIKLDTAKATADVNWPMLRDLILSTADLLKKAGKDSVDYIGQVFYNTPFEVAGFKKTAIKRIKNNNQSFYEAFYQTSADSEKVRSIYFALYDALKKTIKDYTGNDFILASVAKKAISESPVNWIAQWTLYDNYTNLPAGLGKVQIALVMTGFKDVVDNKRNDYTFKIYITQYKVNYDFFTW
ncbi:MAG: hypothetical protein ABJA78_16255 [Ferruginibacter sp.]